MGVSFKLVGDQTPNPRTVRRLTPKQDGFTIADTFVRQHPNATPYHRSAWLNAVNEGYGHKVTLLVAFNEKDRIVGVLPLCHLAVPMGKPALVSLPYCDLGGPLADDVTVEQALIEEAKSLAQELRASSLSMRFAGPMVDTENNPGHSDSHKVSMLCPLPQNSEALFKSYKPKLRSQIRKAEKNGLTGAVLPGPEAVEAFYPVFAANMHRLGSPVHSLGWFQALASHYGDDMLVGLVYYDDLVVAAGIVLINGERACIPWASTLAEYNHLAPNMLLYWTLLSHVANCGIKLFDFGRSSPGEGTYRFKKQWGAVPYELEWVDLLGENRSPRQSAGLPETAQKLRTRIEALWRSLPLPVANRLGPLIRKYISL
jgi:FemAB-related protein (PEP-CTERM system-associated)